MRHTCQVLVLVLLGVLPACSGCRQTDAERAARERAEIEERIRDSSALVPYRALKLTARAQGTGREPEAVTALWGMVQETASLPEKAATVEEAQRMAAVYLRLAVAFYRAKQTLREHDEDDFPVFLEQARRAGSPWGALSVPGYDAGMEHLFLGIAVTAMETLDQKKTFPLAEPALYEFSRAVPRPEWPGALRAVSRGGRGLTFLNAGYHYAAEEELTAYLAEVERLPATLPPLGNLNQETAQLARDLLESREFLRATGYFLRAWNRMQLKREELAADDVDEALQSLARLGIENELTWWAMAFVHLQRERYAEAAASLDRLALSPYVDEATRAELQASAQSLRTQGQRTPLFQKERAVIPLARALVARAGGADKVLSSVLGEERAVQILAPFAWLERMQQGLAAVKPEEVAREAGSQGWEALKGKLGGGAPSASPASP